MTREEHEAIYQDALKRIRQSGGVDFITVYDALENEDGSIGWPAFLKIMTRHHETVQWWVGSTEEANALKVRLLGDDTPIQI